MTRRALVAAAAAWVAVAGTPVAAQTPLTVEQVLATVDRAFPLLDAARQEQEAAAGDALSARGAFDLRLQANGDVQRGEVYDNESAAVSLYQPLTFAGANVFGGYRLGRGTFAPYDGKAQTLTDGEWKGGVALPLLRNRAIDSRRGALARTDLGLQLADQRVAASRLRFLGEAALRYWDWVSAGRQQDVASRLLQIAEVRDRDLADAIALGSVAPVERVDNRRAILQRQSGVISARRSTERQSINVSLYLRAVDGSMLRPGDSQVPGSMPPPPPRITREQIEADLRLALANRPDVRAIELTREQQTITLELARNELLPTFDLFAEVSKDAGDGSRTLRGAELDAGATFVLPVQRRQGKGLQRTALANLARLDAELRFARDRVRAEIEDAASALAAALDVVEVVAAEVLVARELEQAERDRFALGDSTQFLVNLRELATADAAFREISATAEAHKARVAYDVATARLAVMTGNP
ncbi:TolC family protein [Luteitalea sp.]|uniref:TolC family protein n=1 Tax=Luteitalea sp. TaxID=2004800 RepID=UPI0025C2EEE2|nr:TolC family protein [Luteitalea sp.]